MHQKIFITINKQDLFFRKNSRKIFLIKYQQYTMMFVSCSRTFVKEVNLIKIMTYLIIKIIVCTSLTFHLLKG